MFEISRRADYGVRIMLELAKKGPGARVAAGDLADCAAVPKPFLHKIAADLAKVGLLRTFQGPMGGLELGRPMENINLLEILEGVDGPVCLNSCLIRPSECPRDRTCPAHTLWGRLQAKVTLELRSTTLDRLVAETAALEQFGRQESIPYLYPN